jgi:hypothetical protein
MVVVVLFGGCNSEGDSDGDGDGDGDGFCVDGVAKVV